MSIRMKKNVKIRRKVDLTDFECGMVVASEFVNVKPTNLQQLCDAFISIWNKISEECFRDCL